MSASCFCLPRPGRPVALTPSRFLVYRIDFLLVSLPFTSRFVKQTREERTELDTSFAQSKTSSSQSTSHLPPFPFPFSMAKSRPTSSAPKRAVFSSSSTKPARSTSTSTSKKANNVSGFAHRKSLQDPSLSLDPLDAFDLITQKHKRSDISTELSRDEAGTGKGRGGGKRGGEDGEEEEGDDAVRERIRKMIASGDLEGVVEDEDDEEVESDGAWEEMGDEQMGWGGAFMTRTGRKKKGGSKKVSSSSPFFP